MIHDVSLFHWKTLDHPKLTPLSKPCPEFNSQPAIEKTPEE
jgi:hypothetical protein